MSEQPLMWWRPGFDAGWLEKALAHALGVPENRVCVEEVVEKDGRLVRWKAVIEGDDD